MWVMTVLVWILLVVPVFLMAPMKKMDPFFIALWLSFAVLPAGLLGFWIDQCKYEILGVFEDLGNSVWAREDLWGRVSAEERRHGYVNFVRKEG